LLGIIPIINDIIAVMLLREDNNEIMRI
jgi:hypothetical protein